MAQSFIDYKDKGYWVADDFVMFIARYLIEAYKRMPKKSHWQGKMKDDLFVIAMGAYNGCKDLYLDKYLDREYKIPIYINWVDEAKKMLEAKGRYITKEEINSFDYYEDAFVPQTEDLETRILIDLYDKVIEIVNGKSGGDASSKSVLPFHKID